MPKEEDVLQIIIGRICQNLNEILLIHEDFEDRDLILKLKERLSEFSHAWDTIDKEEMQFLREKLEYLENNYRDVFELTFYFEMLEASYVKRNHDRFVADLRRKNRLKKASKNQ